MLPKACINMLTLIIKAAAELPVTQNFNSSNCWGVGVLGGGGGAHACIIIIVIGLYAWMVLGGGGVHTQL